MKPTELEGHDAACASATQPAVNAAISGMQRLQNVGNKIILGMRPRSCSFEALWGLKAGERRRPNGPNLNCRCFALTLQATCSAASMTLTNTAKCYKSAALCHSAPSGGGVTDNFGPHCGMFSVSFPGSSSPLRCCALLRVIRFKTTGFGSFGWCYTRASAVEPLFSFV